MGKVMKAVMAALAGKTVDGKKVSEAVSAKLELNVRSRGFTRFCKGRANILAGLARLYI